MTLKFIRANGLATIADVKRYIEGTGVSHVALTDEEVRTLVHTLMYDGLVEQTLGSGHHGATTHGGDTHGVASSNTAYKPAHAHDRDAAAALSLGAVSLTPCTRCPVAHLCGKTADITPTTCVYLTPFLDF